MAVSTREQFKDYILRRLGYPIQEVHVDAEQLEDRIDDALKFYREYHSDGTDRVYYKHLVTEDDKSNRYFTLPDSIIGVSRLVSLGGVSGGAADPLFNVQYQMTADVILNMGTGSSIIPFHLAMSSLNEFNFMFDNTPSISFNQQHNRLYINSNWTTLSSGSYVVMEAWQYLDEDTWTEIWDDRWLKRYATALVKKQWGENIKVFQGVQILGGITLNGDKIFDEAVAEIEKLEDELINSHSWPVMDDIG